MNDSLSKTESLGDLIKSWGIALGFDEVRITDARLQGVQPYYEKWIGKNFHGEMDYMAKNAEKRINPSQLVEGVIRVISVRMNYFPPHVSSSEDILNQSDKAYISRYALGRDYHKVLRGKLQQLAEKIENEVGPFIYRAFTDSAPVFEVALGQQSGLGWQGKHTLLINKTRGSWFFLGELYTSLDLPVDAPEQNHCGTCQACLDVCPTKAIVAPYQLDARRCISYLTIEHKGAIPIEFRPMLGNRIYGCDDCQLVCPWNRFGQITKEKDFEVRHGLDDISLVEVFLWSEETFLSNMQGSAIYRIGYERWLRNIAVALGNATTSPSVIKALQAQLDYPSELVREHVNWALQEHDNRV
jgi:epoxyqueuosine reductase